MHRNFLITAKALAKRTPTRPLNSDSRRAISTAYYAMFHCLAKLCADTVIGATQVNRTDRAWVQVYRALNHGTAKSACKECIGKGTGVGFPQEIIDFADYFVTMQQWRHSADYDPNIRFRRSQVLSLITGAEIQIIKFEAADMRHKRAFVALVLFHNKRRN